MPMPLKCPLREHEVPPAARTFLKPGRIAWAAIVLAPQDCPENEHQQQRDCDKYRTEQ
jgi:hypothetical protein